MTQPRGGALGQLGGLRRGRAAPIGSSLSSTRVEQLGGPVDRLGALGRRVTPSTLLELLFHGCVGYARRGGPVKSARRARDFDRGERSRCSSTRCPATRSSARTRWRRSTAAGGGSSSELGHRVPARRGARGVPRRRAEGRGRATVKLRPRVHPRAGRQGAARVRPAGAQPGAARVHIGGDHMVFASVYGLPVRPRGRRPPRRDDGRLREPRALSQAFPRARLAGRHDLSSPNDTPLDSRHLDMVYALQTLSDKPYMGSVTLGPERRRHDRDGRDPVRRAARRSRRRRRRCRSSTSTRRCASTTACSARCSST